MTASGVAPAKDRFTSLDTLALVRELRAAGRLFIDKAFDVGPDTWELTLRGEGRTKWALLLAAGRYGTLRATPSAHAEELGHLSRELRKHLAGSQVSGIGEPHGERLLELESHPTGAPRLRLIVEFFGKGNLLLVKDSRIVAVAHAQSWAHRALRPGAEYLPPPAHGDPWTMGIAELEAGLARSRTDRVRTLAAPLGFGAPLAEEILERAGVAGAEPATQETATVAEALHRVIAEVLREVGDQPRGYLYRHQGDLVDVEPYRSVRWQRSADVDVEAVDRFSDAASTYFSAVGSTPVAPPVDPAAELRRQESRQQSAIAALRAEADRLRGLADAVFAHYEAAEEGLRASTDQPEREVVDVVLGGVVVPLRRDRSPRESAQEIYQEVKRLQAKIAGAEAALAATRGKIANVPAPEDASANVPGARRGDAHRTLWFEKFHWFVTSEGVLVVGGRDAATNDLLVRRHLGSNDVYVHADVHGAASVVVKHPPAGQPDPGPRSLTEAGQWAASYSKAWRAGLASADAFWVRPDQVSKRPASGEFVPRGAWVIHGTKNWVRDCPLELGLGQLDYEGETRWTAAPVAAVRTRGRLRLVLTPGPERERSEREVEVSRELGISRDLVQRLLPAGGLSIRRV